MAKAKLKKWEGRLPTGEITGDTKFYAKEWGSLAKTICDALPEVKLRASSFDPGISFAHGKYQSVNLPTDVCLAIARLYLELLESEKARQDLEDQVDGLDAVEDGLPKFDWEQDL